MDSNLVKHIGGLAWYMEKQEEHNILILIFVLSTELYFYISETVKLLISNLTQETVFKNVEDCRT